MKKTAQPILRWAICGVLFCVGITGLLITLGDKTDYPHFFFCLCIPLYYYSFDRLFRYLSIRIYERDFILWLRGSSEIDDSLFADNPHVKVLDKVFSVGLLIIIVVSTFFWIGLMKLITS